MRDHRFAQARLSDYLDGELSPGERGRVEKHVHWCPECRHLLESLRRALRGLAELRATPVETIAPGVIDRLRREGQRRLLPRLRVVAAGDEEPV